MGVLGVAGFPAGNFCSFLRCYCRYIRLDILAWNFRYWLVKSIGSFSLVAILRSTYFKEMDGGFFVAVGLPLRDGFLSAIISNWDNIGAAITYSMSSTMGLWVLLVGPVC
ncbi:hypothetical protein OUZ56_028090 [Daphnia magna]|uniref:Uncharacterized protein n=1 Tax=Daphnia magna TaxID=35525 RepID=A0ABR0B2T9_9CRUS|nr:hypothetical protein OUZ56_028090 [Daphnia magna]